MTINKFQGKTKEEAIEKAKIEFGPNAVIMNIKEVKPKGLFSAFKSSTYEVTAAMEEKEQFSNISQNAGMQAVGMSGASGVSSMSGMSSMSAMQMTTGTSPSATGIRDSINYAADEPIKLPIQEPAKEAKPLFTTQEPKKMKHILAKEEERYSSSGKKIEERLDTLSNMLEERLGVAQKEKEENAASRKQSSEELHFIRILYNTLITNEVNEKYVNEILSEMERFMRPGNNVDVILSNVYQKLILRFGEPNTISMEGSKPKIVFFVGPTGVGKTTSIAKIASKYKVDENRKVAFITADTYRIAATEQLRVYANILDAPISIVYKAEELNDAITRLSDYDLIFVDTAGFSHKNTVQKEDIKNLIKGLDSEYESETYLVLSATTKYNDLKDIVDMYHEISDYKLIFTKLDETSCYGNILNIKLYSGADLSYVTTGQNVPDDLEVFDTQMIVKQLLGGK